MNNSFGFMEGFKVMNKVCDMLEENGCPTEISADLGAEIFFTVVRELGIQTPTDVMSVEDALEILRNEVE